jgi:hypothetical protein
MVSHGVRLSFIVCYADHFTLLRSFPFISPTISDIWRDIMSRRGIEWAPWVSFSLTMKWMSNGMDGVVLPVLLCLLYNDLLRLYDY